MIVFVVTFRGRQVISEYLRAWVPHIPAAVLFYEDLPRVDVLPRATYVFTDLERATPGQRRAASALAEQLGEWERPPRIVNHPDRVLTRYDLLRALHERGVNPFRAYRLFEPRVPERYPVFLRPENLHQGATTRLLYSRREVDREIARACARGLDIGALLVVEFCDTADELGRYWTHGAFVVDGEILPQILHWGPDWMVKLSTAGPPDLDRQRAWVQANPFADELAAIARLAGVDWGRFDYAVQDGKLRVWELNTNPTIMPPAGALEDIDLERLSGFVPMIEAALLGLADPAQDGRPVRLRGRLPDAGPPPSVHERLPRAAVAGALAAHVPWPFLWHARRKARSGR